MPGAPKDAVPVAVPVNKPEEKSAVPVVKQEEKPAASVAKAETKPTVPAVKSEEHPAPASKPEPRPAAVEPKAEPRPAAPAPKQEVSAPVQKPEAQPAAPVSKPEARSAGSGQQGLSLLPIGPQSPFNRENIAFLSKAATDLAKAISTRRAVLVPRRGRVLRAIKEELVLRAKTVLLPALKTVFRGIAPAFIILARVVSRGIGERSREAIL